MRLPEVHGGFVASRQCGLPRAGVRRRSLARAGGRPGAGDGGEAADPAGQELVKKGRRRIRLARSCRRGGGGSGEDRRRPRGEVAGSREGGGLGRLGIGIRWILSGGLGIQWILSSRGQSRSLGGPYRALYRGCCDPNSYSNPGIRIVLLYIYIYASYYRV